MPDLGAFGSGLGAIIGGQEAKGDLNAGNNQVNATAYDFYSTVRPFSSFGQSFLPTAGANIGAIQKDAEQRDLTYENFMKNYQTSPAAQYQIGVADAGINNSASARGDLLSGANLKAISETNQGIANTYANQAYGNYLAGNQQSFNQLETSLGNMFKAIGVGQTATGQTAPVITAQMGNQAALAEAQAKNSQSKGSGFGSLFSGLLGAGKIAAAV